MREHKGLLQECTLRNHRQRGRNSGICKTSQNLLERIEIATEGKNQTSQTIKLQSNENKQQRNNFREYPRTRIYDGKGNAPSQVQKQQAKKDLFQYDEFSEYVPLSEEWANKGLKWLKSLLKKSGEPKAGQNLGFREIEIIKNATPKDFSFVCFHDTGNKFYYNYVPVYNVAGMDYFVYGGTIQVIG